MHIGEKIFFKFMESQIFLYYLYTCIVNTNSNVTPYDSFLSTVSSNNDLFNKEKLKEQKNIDTFNNTLDGPLPHK